MISRCIQGHFRCGKGGFLYRPDARLRKETRPEKPRVGHSRFLSALAKALPYQLAAAPAGATPRGTSTHTTPITRMIRRRRRSPTISPTNSSPTIVTDGGRESRPERSVTTLEDAVCGRLGCRRTEDVAIVDSGDDYPRALCAHCRAEYLEVVA